MSTNEHREAAGKRAVQCAVLTVSDTRTAETDVGGDTVCRILEEHGHTVVQRGICPDEASEIGRVLGWWLDDESIQAVVTTGGTGISPRDTTIEIVERLLTTKMDGFGELFRMLSWDEVGAAAMLSRATAGLAVRQEGPAARDIFVFAIPGSVNAVETAVGKLIAPELSHLVWERKKR
ncbi:MAG: MogA/MoaB family molybdenum cofactor biosynthesis protein [Planctomycetes bacterium]|nr:MogA/MoaB family molybdenum cofactor biosynthesis protein [Planctomycetota bacterium]NOG55036.1 MogA/MoaB family molybdenum cofactor biosynthesis protein [Planctomycetota bacterium]